MFDEVSLKRLATRSRLLAELGDPPPRWRPFKRRAWMKRYRAVMAIDVSQYAEMMEHWYPASMIERLTNSPRPSFAMLTRKEAVK